MTSAPAVAQPAAPPARGRSFWPGRPELSWAHLRRIVEHTIPNALVSPLGLAWLFTLTTAIVTAFQVRDYYLVHLPHFDSIGGYLNAFNVMNITVTKGRIPGIMEAT